MITADRMTILGRARAAVGAQLAIDRTGLTPAPPDRRVETRFSAVFAVAVFSGCAALLSTLGAVPYITGSADPQPTQSTDVGAALAWRVSQIVLVVVAVCLIKGFRQRPRPKSPAPSIASRTRVFTYFVAFLGPWIGMTLMDSIAALGVPTIDYPYTPTPTTADIALQAFGMLLAGPFEETLFLALPVVALRRGGYSWTTVCVVAVLLRVPFHLYYGWSALALAVWAVLMVALYRRTGTVVPIVLAHSTWNLCVYPSVAAAGGQFVLYVCWGVGAVAVIWTLFRWHRRPQPAVVPQVQRRWQSHM